MGGEGLLPPGVLPLTVDDPTELGGHPLIGRIGTGGMGVVYLGRDSLGGLVAVKSAHAEMVGEETTRRFEAEVACLRRVPPACTTRLIADGSGRTPPYIITEYVEGRSLEHLVEAGGPLQPEQVHALATGVGRALAAIHEAGLVHRDLKPGNVLLTPTGPRVIDFGIAQEVGAAGGPTGPQMVVGSPGWIPPERLNRYPATSASDVFGWGCLVAYAGTGRNPFGGGDADEIAHRTLNEPPGLDGIRDPLHGLVAGALAKDPAVRPSAAEILERLAPGSGGASGYPAPPIAMRVGAPERSGTRVAPLTALSRRRWQAVAGAAVTAAALLAAVIATTAADHDAPRTPSSAPPSATPSDGGVAATQRAAVTRPRATSRAPSHWPATGHGRDGGHKGGGKGKPKGGGHG
jgi:hypothetical protein